MLNFHCSICQQCFSENNTMSALLCGHVYHLDCIKMWLDKKSNCPQCRSPNVGNFIRKLYFEKICDISLNSTDYNTEESSKLILEIDKLKESNNNLIHEKSFILTELKNKTRENEELLKKITSVQDIQRSEYLSSVHQISEKEDEIKICKIKLDKLKFINDLLNKQQLEIDLYIANMPQSDNLQIQNEKLCSAIVSCKNDLDFYKKNSDNISKKLVKTELKAATLLSEISCLKKEISKLKSSDLSFQETQSMVFETSINVIPETPVNRNRGNLTRELSTPEILMMSSPETSSNVNDGKLFRQRMLENPFRCTPSQIPKKNTKNLLEMAIMKNHSSRQTATTNIVWYRDEDDEDDDDDDRDNRNPSDGPEKKRKKFPRSKHIQPIKRN